MNHPFRIALFDQTVFRELDDQPEYMFRALRTVIISAVAFSLGIWSNATQNVTEERFVGLTLVFITGIATILMSWILWAAFAWILGSKFFGGSSGYRLLLRNLGLSYLPICAWLTLGFPYGGYLVIVGHIWLLATGITAIKNAQEFAWWKSIIAGAIGWVWALILVPKYVLFP